MILLCGQEEEDISESPTTTQKKIDTSNERR